MMSPSQIIEADCKIKELKALVEEQRQYIEELSTPKQSEESSLEEQAKSDFNQEVIVQLNASNKQKDEQIAKLDQYMTKEISEKDRIIQEL